MSDKTLRSALIRLANENPELQRDLLPLLGRSKKAAYLSGGVKSNLAGMAEEGDAGGIFAELAKILLEIGKILEPYSKYDAYTLGMDILLNPDAEDALHDAFKAKVFAVPSRPDGKVWWSEAQLDRVPVGAKLIPSKDWESGLSGKPRRHQKLLKESEDVWYTPLRTKERDRSISSWMERVTAPHGVIWTLKK